MFELEKEIVAWRNEMYRKGIKCAEVLDELEGHLRIETQRQVDNKKNLEKAFQDAIEKIGAPEELKGEFDKARSMRVQKALTIFVASTFSLIIAFILICMVFRLGSVAEMDLKERRWGIAGVLLTVLSGWGGFLCAGFCPIVTNKKVRDAIAFSGAGLLVLWLIVFLNLVIPRMELGMGELLVALSWGFVLPWGLVMGLIGGVDSAFARRKSAIA
jgi:hypothetical protein